MATTMNTLDLFFSVYIIITLLILDVVWLVYSVQGLSLQLYVHNPL